MRMPRMVDASTQTEPEVVRVLDGVKSAGVVGVGVQFDHVRPAGIRTDDPQRYEGIEPPQSVIGALPDNYW